MKKIITALLVAVMGVLAASESMADASIEGRYWFSSLDAKLRISSGSTAGTELDPVGDLGFEKKKQFPEVRVMLGGDANRLRYAFVPLKWNGSSTISKSIVFNGKTYAASTPVTSELKVNYHRLGWEYNFVNTLDNKFAYILDVKYFDISANVNAPSIGLAESKSMKAVVPTMGFLFQFGLPTLLNASAEATGAMVSSNKYIYDVEASLNLKLMPFVFVSAGYRVLKLHLEEDNDLAVFTLKGPYAALKAEF